MAMSRDDVKAWLMRYAWAEQYEEDKAAVVACVLAQDEWRHISARAEQYDGAWADAGEPAPISGDEFALSALYECHDGPHLLTCARANVD